ncbi:MAG: type II CAAX endopeptidase family protein [Anaerolineales bacterium]|jgi:membrane protease YdiL (CAAX protease family)
MKKLGSQPAANPRSAKPVQSFSLARPILTCIILFLIALLFKWIDTFVLRWDELLGELILTKSLGFALVVAWVWAAGRKLMDIGLNANHLGWSLLIGALTTLFAFMVGYGVEFLFAAQQGAQPAFYLGAIDPKMGVTGGTLFALWLVSSNFVNSFMEEGLFRGVIGRLARIRLSFWGTNWFQAFMFSIWHLPWVLKYYLLGEIESGSEIAMSVFFNSIPQLLIGIVYGYFFLKTGNLWAPWIAHTLSNSTGNIVHVTTSGGMDAGMPLRMAVYTVVMLLSLFWVRYVARRNQLPELKPWE